MPSPLLVVLNGLPGSGKTTLARKLSPILGATLLSKDLIKESLYEAFELDNDAASLAGSVAAMRLIYATAATSGGPLIVEANWKAMDVPQLRALERPAVQVVCSAPPSVLRSRVLHRIESGERHPVHRDRMAPAVLARMIEYIDRQDFAPLDLGCAVVDVDTSADPDVERVAEMIRVASLAGSSE